jgi:hypothetical protein
LAPNDSATLANARRKILDEFDQDLANFGDLMAVLTATEFLRQA